MLYIKWLLNKPVRLAKMEEGLMVLRVACTISEMDVDRSLHVV